jgi:4-hydroxy-tetrahydrodipicolinate synthase
MTVAERADAIRTVADELGGRVPFMPGTGTAKLDETLELTRAAIDAGADAAMIITPYYARPTQEALYQWYARICTEFPGMPFVAYNVPSRTAVDLAPETVARLSATFENFVGIKETTKDFEHFSRVMHLCGKDLLVWSGIELLCLPLLAIGGVGFISALCNIAPRAVADMYDAWTAGDSRRAARSTTASTRSWTCSSWRRTRPQQMGDGPGGPHRSDTVRPPLISPTPAGIAGSGNCWTPGPATSRPLTAARQRISSQHRKGSNHDRHRPAALHTRNLPTTLQHYIDGSSSTPSRPHLRRP